MKEYPSILGPNGAPNLPCIAFKKYDGSNLRFEWERKKGWHLFGTRRRLFDRTDPEYGCAIDIFLKKYADDLEKIIKKDKHFRSVREVICYCEFFGPHSFGGQHDPKNPVLNVESNDPKDVVLFDVNVHKKGLLTPRQFVNTFEGLPVAEVVYEGILNQEFINEVKGGQYLEWGVVEGVVAKGCEGPPPHGIWMRKIKTLAYLEDLKKRFGTGWEQYGE